MLAFILREWNWQMTKIEGEIQKHRFLSDLNGLTGVKAPFRNDGLLEKYAVMLLVGF